MKTIFDNQDAIQINKAWEYDESDHKWTINENDVIEHIELSQEIYNDFHKLDQYNLVLEEAYSVYDRLVNQVIENNNILNNTRVTLEHVSLSNECLSICKAQLGYDVIISRSNESEMTNYERLILSNEGIIDFIKELITKIKELFKKVWNFFKNLFIKILRWLGLWEDKLDKMHKEVKTNLSNESYEDTFQNFKAGYSELLSKCDIQIDSEIMFKVLNKFPLLCITLYKCSTFKQLFNILNFKDILSPITNNLDTTLKNIKDGNLKELNTSTFMKELTKYINKQIKDKKASVMFITNLTDNKINYLEYNTENNEITGYTEFKIDTNFDIDTKYLANIAATISIKDIDTMFDDVKKNYIQNIKKYENEIKKLHVKLDKLMIEIDKSLDIDNNNELIKNKRNLQIIKTFGTNIPYDLCSFIHTTIKKNIEILTLLYNEIKPERINNHERFINEFNKYQIGITNNYNKENPNQNINLNDVTTKLNFLNNDKNLPYITASDSFWDNVAFYGNCVGGMAWPKRTPDGDSIFKTCDYTGIIFLDVNYYNGTIPFEHRLKRMGYPTGMSKTLLEMIFKDQLKYFGLDLMVGLLTTCQTFEEFDENFKRNKEFMIKNSKSNKIKYLDYWNYNHFKIYYNYDPGYYDITFSKLDLQLTYYHEAGHIILKQSENPNFDKALSNRYDVRDTYLFNWVENQADAYAMMKVGVTLNYLANWRCKKQSPFTLDGFQELYKQNIRKQLDEAKRWGKIKNINKLIANIDL